MRNILLCVAFALLAGCATPTPEVRVIRPPPPPVIEMPPKPSIPKEATQEQKLRAIADYVLTLRARLEEALLALKVYE